MTHWTIPGRLLGAAAMLLGGVGCENHMPARVYPDSPDPQAAARALELYDRNHDGFLSGDELDQVPGLKSAMKQVDTDHDGKISAAEIAARIRSWGDSQIGRMAIRCTVTRHGKPLVAAVVQFVPEKFLGGALTTAAGTTDSLGTAMIAGSGGEPSLRGVSPGFYRVEITKVGEKIPAQYNTATTLGEEVARDAENSEREVRFDLGY